MRGLDFKFFRKKKVMLFLSWPFLLLVSWMGFSGAATNTEELKSQLEAQISQLQGKIEQYGANIEVRQKEARSLERDIAILDDQIEQVKLQISQMELVIRESDSKIESKEEEIAAIERQIKGKRELLAEYIRTISEYDKENILVAVFREEKVTNFFKQIASLELIQKEIKSGLESVKTVKGELENNKASLEEERAGQCKMKSLQELQRISVQRKQDEKESILKETKGKEKAYQEKIAGAQKDIEYLRKQISLLDKYHLTLEDAVQFAVFAATKTGIRPEYLLGVLEYESRLGLNVGSGNWKKDLYQCYKKLGSPTKAEKEKAAFFAICQALDLNPDLQPVSAEPYYGCGGAMGPAQFMPTTWQAYAERITSVTGNNPPNPWNPQDAFVASAIKLADLGATERTDISERNAYAKYLGGGNWKKYTSFGQDVVDLSKKFRDQLFSGQ